MPTIYKNGIAYGGAAVSSASLIEATDPAGGSSNVQTELNRKVAASDLTPVWYEDTGNYTASTEWADVSYSYAKSGHIVTLQVTVTPNVDITQSIGQPVLTNIPAPFASVTGLAIPLTGTDRINTFNDFSQLYPSKMMQSYGAKTKDHSYFITFTYITSE